MKIVWHPLALEDVAAMVDFISEDDPRAARGMVQRIRATARMLSRHPGAGRPGRVIGTREMIVPGTSYILPYRVEGDEVEILRVYHATRRWPNQF